MGYWVFWVLGKLRVANPEAQRYENLPPRVANPREQLGGESLVQGALLDWASEYHNLILIFLKGTIMK